MTNTAQRPPSVVTDLYMGRALACYSPLSSKPGPYLFFGPGYGEISLIAFL